MSKTTAKTITKNTHGGAGRGQGRNPEGNAPKIVFKRLIQQETFDAMESLRIDRGLKTVGDLLDQDYGPLEVVVKSIEACESALDKKSETVEK